MDALRGFFADANGRDFGEWFEWRLRDARQALDALKSDQRLGFDYLSPLSDLLENLDDAQSMCRTTSGEALSYWEKVASDAEADISEIIDDLGSVTLARIVVAAMAHDQPCSAPGPAPGQP